MRILDLIVTNGIIPSLRAETKSEVLAELVGPIVQADSTLDQRNLVKSLIERENLGSTGIDGGIAIPHGRFAGLDGLVASFGRSPGGIDFDAMDSKPSYLFFLLLAPDNSAGDHLKALARISRLLKDPILKNTVQQAESAEEILRLLDEYDLKLP